MSGLSPMALAPDPAVPQRNHLTDLDAIARRLSAQLDPNGRVPIQTCRRACVSYRVGKRLRVVYQVGIDGGDLYVTASTFRSSSRSGRAYSMAVTNAPDLGGLRPALHDTELDTVFWVFPNDRKIEDLSAVADVTDELARLVDGPWVKSQLVDYYPEVSAVVRCLDDSNRVIAYAKIHVGDEGERTFRMQQELERVAKGSRLRVATPLAYSKRHRTLLVEPIVGPSIGRLKSRDLLAGLHAYGAALATLHSLPVVDIAPNEDSALERLQQKADGISAVRPDVEGMVCELLGELSARWEEAAGKPVLVHGDTNENNAILQGDRIALIDFDRASIGSAGSDIGNLLGLMRYYRSLGLISPSIEQARAAAFKSGYSSVRALPNVPALSVHESAALAERAFRAVTRLRPRALTKVPALLSEACTLLQLKGGRA
ncbi:MAG: phosphotransferase [Actinomycetota bacterium]